MSPKLWEFGKHATAHALFAVAQPVSAVVLDLCLPYSYVARFEVMPKRLVDVMVIMVIWVHQKRKCYENQEDYILNARPHV